jgi:hypothetical protein
MTEYVLGNVTDMGSQLEDPMFAQRQEDRKDAFVKQIKELLGGKASISNATALNEGFSFKVTFGEAKIDNAYRTELQKSWPDIRIQTTVTGKDLIFLPFDALPPAGYSQRPSILFTIMVWLMVLLITTGLLYIQALNMPDRYGWIFHGGPFSLPRFA